MPPRIILDFITSSFASTSGPQVIDSVAAGAAAEVAGASTLFPNVIFFSTVLMMTSEALGS